MATTKSKRGAPSAADTNKKKTRALALLASGKSVSEAAEAVGVAVSSVYSWKKEGAPSARKRKAEPTAEPLAAASASPEPPPPLPTTTRKKKKNKPSAKRTNGNGHLTSDALFGHALSAAGTAELRIAQLEAENASLRATLAAAIGAPAGPVSHGRANVLRS